MNLDVKRSFEEIAKDANHAIEKHSEDKAKDIKRWLQDFRFKFSLLAVVFGEDIYKVWDALKLATDRDIDKIMDDIRKSKEAKRPSNDNPFA